MGIVKLHHVQVNIPAASAEEARRFYGQVLGLEEMPRPASLSNAGRNGAWFRVGDDGEFHVFFNPQPEFSAEDSSQHPAFIVEDLMALRTRLEAAQAPLEDAIPIGGRQRFFARDPGGNRLEFLAFA